jgi:hypothetical protein
MIRFSCPSCNKKLRVADQAAGKKVCCPRCGNGLVIPTQANHDKPVDQVMVACPKCGRSIPLKPDELSVTIECARCEARFVPDDQAPVTEGESAVIDTPEIHFPDDKPRHPIRRLAILGALIVGLAISGYLLVSALTWSPATCKGVAERLQRTGMDIRWDSCDGVFGYPAIAIAMRDVPDYEQKGFTFTDHGATFEYSVAAKVYVIQYPTEKEAAEKAGAKPGAFSWGRFMFSGDELLLKDIKSRL